MGIDPDTHNSVVEFGNDPCSFVRGVPILWEGIPSKARTGCDVDSSSAFQRYDVLMVDVYFTRYDEGYW